MDKGENTDIASCLITENCNRVKMGILEWFDVLDLCTSIVMLLFGKDVDMTSRLSCAHAPIGLNLFWWTNFVTFVLNSLLRNASFWEKSKGERKKKEKEERK
jgi:hypothetical protein